MLSVCEKGNTAVKLRSFFPLSLFLSLLRLPPRSVSLPWVLEGPSARERGLVLAEASIGSTECWSVKWARAGGEITPSVLSVPLPLPHLLCLSLVQLQPLLHCLRLQHGTEHMSQSMTTERRSASHHVRHRREKTLMALENVSCVSCLRQHVLIWVKRGFCCRTPTVKF